MELPFIKERRHRWERLNQLLEQAKHDKLTSLNKNDLMELSVLYRQTTTDLVLAKAQGLPADLLRLLNDLVSRAYHLIYRTEKTSWHQLGRLFTTEFPILFRQNWGVILFAFSLLVLGGLMGFYGYLLGQQVITGLLPQRFVTEIIQRYESNTWFNSPLTERPFVSSWIMSNNIQVAVKAFAGGMLAGVLTGWVVLYNGLMLGALAAVFWKQGYFLSFWAMILPHGVIELTAIGTAAAAGMLLARAILFPGEVSRQDALKLHGTTAAKLMTGTILLLVVAGLIEGFFSTIDTKVIPEAARLGFAGFTALLLFWYLKPHPQTTSAPAGPGVPLKTI